MKVLFSSPLPLLHQQPIRDVQRLMKTMAPFALLRLMPHVLRLLEHDIETLHSAMASLSSPALAVATGPPNFFQYKYKE